MRVLGQAKVIEWVPRSFEVLTFASVNTGDRKESVMGLPLSLEFRTCRDLLPLSYFYILYRVEISTLCSYNCYFRSMECVSKSLS